MEYYNFSQPAAAVKSSSFHKRPTPSLVRTYGGDREMYRDVATLRMLMSWIDSGTLYGTRIAHRMAESGYTSAECTNPSINQVSRRILSGFCNISTWKASSGRNLKTNSTKPGGAVNLQGAFCH